MGRKSKSPTRNRAPDLRIRRSDVLQLSCREFYVEPAECNTRLGYSRSIRVHYRQQTKHSGENNNIVTNKWLMSPGVRRRVRRGRENRVNEARGFRSECKGNIKVLDLLHCNAFESTVDVKGQCMGNHYRISLLNKIPINLKESLFFQLNSVERCLNSPR